MKTGAENMIQMYSSGRMRDKKLLTSAKAMLADSKAKIEYIRMRVNMTNGLSGEAAKGTCFVSLCNQSDIYITNSEYMIRVVLSELISVTRPLR